MITVTGKTEHDKATIEIRDSGIGMSEETKAHIFERFYRADQAHSTPGFGLGLSIAQTIIEKHSGQIDVEAEACDAELARGGRGIEGRTVARAAGGSVSRGGQRDACATSLG